MGRIIPYIMENKKCSKPPTSIYIHINGGVLSHGGTPSSLDGSFHGNPTEKMDDLGTHVQASPGMRTCPMEEGGIHLQGSLGHGCRRDSMVHRNDSGKFMGMVWQYDVI